MKNIKKLTLVIAFPMAILLGFISFQNSGQQALLILSIIWGGLFAVFSVAELEGSVNDLMLGLLVLMLLLVIVGASLLTLDKPIMHPKVLSWFGGGGIALIAGIKQFETFALFRINATFEGPRLPAGVWLGLWLGVEVVLTGASGVISSMIFGSLFVVVICVCIGSVIRALELNHVPQAPLIDDVELGQRLSQVNRLTSEFQLAQARKEIERIVVSRPNNLEVLRIRYAVWKFSPTEPVFHESFSALLTDIMTIDSQAKSVFDYYQDYVAVTQGKPELTDTLHLRLAMFFADHGWLDVASGIVNLFLRRHKQHGMLPGCLVALANAYINSENYSKAKHFAETIVAIFPDQPEYNEALDILEHITTV